MAFCISYRKDPVNKYYFDKIARGEDLALSKELEEMGLRGFSIHKNGALDGGPVQLVRQGLIDMEPLLDIWTHEEMVRFNMMMKEQAWVICDRVTRETRRLVKLLVINDFWGEHEKIDLGVSFLCFRLVYPLFFLLRRKGMPFRKPPSSWMSAFGNLINSVAFLIESDKLN